MLKERLGSPDRTSGLLLHPTSLPGRFPIGDLGPGAERFLDWAALAGAGLWQVLPLTAPELDSPYGGQSAFAGSPLLISPERLVDQGFLEARDLASAPTAEEGRVSYERAGAWKEGLLRRAFDRVRGDSGLGRSLETFAEAPSQRSWLEDWVLFRALRERHKGLPWWKWPAGLVHRKPDALATARQELGDELSYHSFVQMLFFEQWDGVRRAARQRGIRIFGDLPIYVSADGADVWARQDLFELDEEGRQLSQAGVPPDDYSDTGQLWGFPLYRWDRMAADGYGWWIERMAANLRHADLVRLDHFRAFAGYWRVGASEETAVKGRWEPGPGRPLFDALSEALGELPLVAEDLGVITPDVDELREGLGLPSMRVLQFGFDDPESPHAVRNIERDCVVYTGTHDNDTAVGWYYELAPEFRHQVDLAIEAPGESIQWRLIRQAHASKAWAAVVPVQDVLGLGSGARLNTPGTEKGNWRWRLEEHELGKDAAEELHRIAEAEGRLATSG